MRPIALAAIAVVFALPPALQAQELPTAQKYEGVSWIKVYDVSFKEGQARAALRIMYEHILPAMEAAGVPPFTIIEYKTGPWDARYILPMSGGPGDMEWEIPPDAEVSFVAMAEREGGIEQVTAIWREYIKKLARSSSNVALIRSGGN